MDALSELPKPTLSFKEAVIPIPKDLIHPDSKFPSIGIKSFTAEEIASISAKQVTESDNIGAYISEASVNLGRGTFSKSGIKLETTDELRTAAVLLTKSTGVPLVVRNHWKSYQEKPAFFYHESTEADRSGDTKTVLTHNPDFFGISTKQDQVIDAQKSLELHSFGTKVRLPVAGWQVDSFEVKGKEGEQLVVRKTIEWFKAQGFKGDELYQSAWAMSCPFRLEDINDFLISATAEEGLDLPALDGFIRTMIALAKGDKTQNYQDLFKKWNTRTQDSTLLTQSEIVDVLEDFGVALCKTMGQNYDVLYQNKIRHGNLSPQNISFFGELCDNSTVSQGLLKIGDAGKDDDLDGFSLAFRKYAERLFVLKGENPFTDSEELEKYIFSKFYSPLKTEWTSYEMFCEERYSADVEENLHKTGRRIRLEVEEIGGYPEENLDEVVKRQVKLNTIKQWPFGELKNRESFGKTGDMLSYKH